ncbi:MAG: response regulator transcription factor [Paracoccaceae bacterium]
MHDDFPERTMRSALIVDDHPLFCDALSMTLKAFVGIAEIDTAERLDEALERLETGLQPDVIVLDLNLPDVDGMEGLINLRRAVDDRPVVVVSSLTDPRIVSAAIAAGASAFVPKHSRREVFRAAFATVAAGGKFLPEGWNETHAEASRQDDAIVRLGRLTRQQAKILQLICQGKLNKQIAYDLSIAETTVKAHVTAIMRKLGVFSRTQAVLMAKETDFNNLLPEVDDTP